MFHTDQMHACVGNTSHMSCQAYETFLTTYSNVLAVFNNGKSTLSIGVLILFKPGIYLVKERCNRISHPRLWVDNKAPASSFAQTMKQERTTRQSADERSIYKPLIKVEKVATVKETPSLETQGPS